MILSTLMMQEIRSSEMSVLTRAIWRHPEDGVLHSRRIEYLKSYTRKNLFDFTMDVERQKQTNFVAFSPQANYIN
jgi:hypothetical protein